MVEKALAGTMTVLQQNEASVIRRKAAKGSLDSEKVDHELHRLDLRYYQSNFWFGHSLRTG